jgi:DNA-binding NarL/FixJ family response regulator
VASHALEIQSNYRNRSTIRVLIADDHDVMHDGIRFMLGTTSDMQLIASVYDGIQALEVFKRTIPDITLMDLRMAGGDGLTAISAIRAYSPSARIIALTTYSGDALVTQARKAGASGYLVKSMLSENILSVIRAVHGGHQAWPVQLMEGEDGIGDELTPRECAVMHFVARGESNKQIGDSLGIGEETVKTYMRSILPKLRANDRAHAVAICMRRGYLDMSDLP